MNQLLKTFNPKWSWISRSCIWLDT